MEADDVVAAALFADACDHPLDVAWSFGLRTHGQVHGCNAVPAPAARPQLAHLRRFVLHLFVAMQAITTIFLVEPTNVGWSVRIGDERVGSFSTQRQALNDVKNRRATLTAKGQRSTVVVTRHRSDPTKR